MWLRHSDINPDGFAIYLTMRYTFGAICAWRHAKKDLYHIALSVAKHIAFCETKYIAHTKCVYRKIISEQAVGNGFIRSATLNEECGIRNKRKVQNAKRKTAGKSSENWNSFTAR